MYTLYTYRSITLSYYCSLLYAAFLSCALCHYYGTTDCLYLHLPASVSLYYYYYINTTTTMYDVIVSPSFLRYFCSLCHYDSLSAFSAITFSFLNPLFSLQHTCPYFLACAPYLLPCVLRPYFTYHYYVLQRRRVDICAVKYIIQSRCTRSM